MARLNAPISVKGTTPAVVEVPDEKADELLRRGFVTESKTTAKKADSSSKSSK